MNLAWSHFFKNIFLEFQICDRHHDPADNQKSGGLSSQYMAWCENNHTYTIKRLLFIKEKPRDLA